jgi:hypothetical protein
LRQLLLKVKTLLGSFRSSSRDWKNRLAIRGRPTLSLADFLVADRLFRGFSIADLDEHGDIDVASFETRDLTCNWDRLSIASDIRHRPNGRNTDGCYSLSVETARFKNLATPCHDPIATADCENYAHVEIRWLNSGEPIDFEPPHGRTPSKSKTAKAARLDWRTNAVRHLRIEIDPTA